MSISSLPALNASLNATCAVLLVTAYLFIRRKKVIAHRNTMLAATTVAALFLVSYLYYHYQVCSVPFQGRGPLRTFYFTILISHTILAVAIVPLAAITLYRGLRKQVARHRKIARFTLPIWLYVSVTGVMIYWMLYRMDVS